MERNEDEERYFRSLDIEQRRELRKRMDSGARALEEKRKIASAAGTEDLSVADRIKALGFDDDSARIFELLPLVHVAWADGSVQRSERAAIFKILEQREISEDSSAFQMMASLLEEKPSDAFMQETLEIVRDMTGGLNSRTADVVDLCIEVAAASGGFLGLGRRIGDEERQLINDIVNTLGSSSTSKVRPTP